MARTMDIGKVDPVTGEITVKNITPFIRTPHNYDRDEESLSCGSENDEPSMTQQQFKDECDINTLLERFGVTGELPVNVRQPISEDFVETFDFQSAQNAIIEAQQAFMQMPAKVRARFENDPQQFIEFFEDEKNREEAERLGLINPKTPAPPAVDTTPKPAPPAVDTTPKTD